MIAVLVSDRAHRTILSTSVIFLVAGFLLGGGVLRWIDLSPTDGVVWHFAEIALFVILFVDGAQLPITEVKDAWHLPGRALLLGMPLTVGAIAAAGRLVLGMTWIEGFLVGAILCPTDPVFVAAVLEREAVPLRLRRLLSVESGLNDGLALPVVMILLALAGHRALHPVRALIDAGLGIAVGALVPSCFLWLEQRRFFGASKAYEPLGGVAVATVIFGLSRMSSGNEFLAAFAGGMTVATIHPRFADSVRKLGLPIAEATKLAALLVFGAVLTVAILLGPGVRGLLFAVIALVVARPLSLALAFLGGGLTTKERIAAAWFGPKGFASLLYALLMLNANLARGRWLFQATALVIVVSIIAHSSTDFAVARVFREEGEHSTGA